MSCSISNFEVLRSGKIRRKKKKKKTGVICTCNICRALLPLLIRERGSNLVPFRRSVRLPFRHPFFPRRRRRPITHGRSKKTARLINGSSTRIRARACACLRRRCIPSLVAVWTTVGHIQALYTRKNPPHTRQEEEEKDRAESRE